MTKTEKVRKIIRLARKYLGKPYVYGAKLYLAPKVFDCSSFIQYLYKKVGVELPRTALDQASEGKIIEPIESKLEPGDLIFIKGGWGHYNPEFPEGIGHVALYVGKGKVINARGEAKKVIEEKVTDFLTRKDLRVIKRILI
ncbi:MAG: C40 family peptidase [Candidatus Woykebacteria bacterium]